MHLGQGFAWLAMLLFPVGMAHWNCTSNCSTISLLENFIALRGSLIHMPGFAKLIQIVNCRSGLERKPTRTGYEVQRGNAAKLFDAIWMQKVHVYFQTIHCFLASSHMFESFRLHPKLIV
jgi:hypothetical protein